jgi:hypothetical protein
VRSAFYLHSVFYVIGEVACASWIGRANGKKDVVPGVSALAVGLAAFVTVSETLQLCFLEAPDKMKEVSEAFFLANQAVRQDK